MSKETPNVLDIVNKAREVLGLSELEDTEKQLSSLEVTLSQLPNSEAPDMQRLRKLVDLFGGDLAADILYLNNPAYRSLSPDVVNSKLGDYLGDYLLENQLFSLDQLESLELPIDLPAVFQKRLVEVFKADVLKHFNEQKKINSDLDRDDLILHHLEQRRSEVEALGLPYMISILDEVLTYYSEILAINKPAHIIDGLDESRDFPDLNQCINVQEIADKKRMLIADEMGMGKSASTIFAREILQLGLTLALVPANVVATWKRYLSDEVDEEGEPVGYFKPGQAPNVLIVESPNDIARLKDEDWDYVVISHEKLNDTYAEALQSLPFEYLIVDEVHKLKNIRDGKQSENLLILSEILNERDGHLALLSGTPVPNTVRDMAVLLKLLYPDTFGAMPARNLHIQIASGDLVQLRSLLVNHMQAKELRDSIDIPPVTEVLHTLSLSSEEESMYQVLLEEDELAPLQKIHLLRRFLLNPMGVKPSVDLPATRMEALETDLAEQFAQHDKVLVFVNHYVKDIMEGDLSIENSINLPPGVLVRKVYGGTPIKQREHIEDEFNNSNGKILLIVSGQTADVGVDYTGAQAVRFFNDPWTKDEKRQQLARVGRPGLKHPVEAKTFLVAGSLEAAMHDYVERKYRAIQKLLKGIPITEMDKRLLSQEAPIQADKELSPRLAQEYLSKVQQMNRLFGLVRGKSDSELGEILAEYGETYASNYQLLKHRSYQANNARVSGTILSSLISADKVNMADTKILDIASGPEMLRANLPESLQPNVMSLDRNESHFKDREGLAVIGSFLQLPIADNSVDYANFSLALGETAYLFTKQNYERLQALLEFSRILKVGGKIVISTTYSDQIKDEEKFKLLAESLGLCVIEKFTGRAESGNQYVANFITLEKLANSESEETLSVEHIVANVGREVLKSLKFSRNKVNIRRQRNVISEFQINDENFDILFNARTQQLADVELRFLETAASMKGRYKGIQNVPREELESRSMGRFHNGSQYRIFKNLGSDGVLIS